MSKQESFDDEFTELMDLLYPNDGFRNIVEYQKYLLNEGEARLKRFLSVIHGRNSFPRLSSNTDE